MEPSTTGSFRLFRLAGIDVFLHWSWFFVAAIQIWMPRENDYQMPAWRAAEYVSLFAIVLLHEFGHALACRSVGGTAERIVLWPLGGVAYVSPPSRPGPVLWSIVAGPLVNFALAPLLLCLFAYAGFARWNDNWPDAYHFLGVLTAINFGLLILNLMPVYPLDGGQILHALLWFAFGRWYSLLAVSVIGIVGGALLFLLSVLLAAVMGAGALLLGFVAVFLVMRSLVAMHTARNMIRLDELPRHKECACPTCATAPPRGDFWHCEHCQSRFDTFAAHGRCPGCGGWFLPTACPHCHAVAHIDRWYKPAEVLDPIVLEPPPAPER